MMIHLKPSSLLLALLLTFPTISNAAPPIWITKAKGQEKHGGSHGAVKRNQNLDLDISQFQPANWQLGQKKKFKADFFSNMNLDIEIALKEVHGSDRGTWIGNVSGSNSEIYISRNKGKAIIDLFIDESHVQVRPGANGDYISEESDVTKFPDLRNDQIGSSILNADSSVLAADASVTVDVLVVFAAEAVTYAGGPDAIVAFADNAAAVFNNAATFSLATPRLRIVKAMASNVASAGSLYTDLSNLTNTADGKYDDATQAADLYGADLVHVITTSADNCGVAYMPGRFGATAASCAIGNKTFAHEIGHNFGLSHDHENETSGLYPYSFGYRFVGTNNVTYRTILAYAPGTRIAAFSNPNVLYAGVPTGVADYADNARALNNRALTTAAYKQTVVPSTAATISFLPSALAFGNLQLGTATKNMLLTISNTGLANMPISGVSLEGAGFQVSGVSSCLVTLAYGQSCQVTVSFAPAAVGSYSGRVVVNSSAAANNGASAALTASVFQPSPIISAPTSLAFSSIAVGSSAQKSFQVSNTGSAALNISAAAITVDAGVFAVVSNACAGAILNPGQSCMVNLSFSPKASGSYSGKFTLNSNDPAKPSAVITLSGATKKGGGKPPR